MYISNVCFVEILDILEVMTKTSKCSTLTSAEFVTLWFSTHGIVRRSEKLAALSSSCIQQVCSMKDIFGSPQAERDWTKATIESIQRTFPNWIPAQRYESAGLS